MSPFDTWLAAQLGLDAAEFDQWHFLWGRQPSGLMLGAVLFALGLYLWLSWRASSKLDRPVYRGAAMFLRLAAALLAAFMAFDPSVEFLKTRRREEAFTVLVDVSRSMELRLKDGITRLERVKKALAEHGDQLDRLEKRYKVQYALFDGSAKPSSRKDLSAVKASGSQTQVGESLDDILRMAAADPPAGVILLSDGADRGRIRAALGGTGALASVPVNPVLLPDAPLPDAAVADVQTDPYAFVRNGFDVKAKIDVRGLKLETLMATLRIDGQVAGAQEVAVPPKGGSVEVTFRTTPQRVGKFVYTVEVPPFAGEAVLENNKRNAIVKVVRDRVRVLQVVGEPSWDERFLRRYLEKDPNVDLISFMILRTQEDENVIPESELSLIPFPTTELFTTELKNFDLVIFQNFDYRPYFNMFPGKLLDNVRRFVEEDGGGFIMLGGDKSFSLGGYAGSPIEPLLPVEISPGAPAIAQPLQPRLTAEGLRHPVTGLDLAPQEAEKVWRQLPPAEGANRVGGLKAGATALLDVQAGGSMPLLSVMEVGKGRTMALAMDSSWMWNFTVAAAGGSGVYYQRFWNNTIRWLVHDPDFGRVRLESDRDFYDPGEAIKTRCTVLDENYRPAEKADAVVSIRSRDGGAWKVLGARQIEPGVFAAEHQPETGGIFDVKCVAKVGGRNAGEESILAGVDTLGEEMKDTAVRNDVLRALAARSGGKTLEIDGDWYADLGIQSDSAFEIVGRRIERIWDNAWLLAMMALLLSTEWFLRRRWGGL